MRTYTLVQSRNYSLVSSRNGSAVTGSRNTVLRVAGCTRDDLTAHRWAVSSNRCQCMLFTLLPSTHKYKFIWQIDTLKLPRWNGALNYTSPRGYGLKDNHLAVGRQNEFPWIPICNIAVGACELTVGHSSGRMTTKKYMRQYKNKEG